MIKRFYVSGFKSLGDVTVELSDVTVLVGRSGTGKSNFVDAVRLLRDLVFRGGFEGVLDGGQKAVAPFGVKEPTLKFQVDFDVAGFDGNFAYFLYFGPDGHEETLSLSNRRIFHRKNRDWVEPPSGVTAKPDGIVLGKLPSSHEARIAFNALTAGIGCYEFPLEVFGTASHAALSGLEDHARNYLDVLKDIGNDLRNLTVHRALVATLATLNPSVTAVDLDSVTKPTRIVVTHSFNGSQFQLPLQEESWGFKRFFAHLLALYQQPPKQLLVFEEPENGIYPGALELLASEITACPESGRGQVLLTTHSPLLLDYFDAEKLRVVTLSGYRTQIGPLAGYQIESVKEGLLRTGELLTVDTPQIAGAEVPGA